MTSCDILIVEDEALIAEALGDCLEVLGHRVVGVAVTRREAVRAVQLHRPHLVLMDIRLKGSGDGIDAAGEIQGRHGVPVVYLTSYSDDATVARAMDSHPYGYLVKPVREVDLKVAVETAIRRHSSEREQRASHSSIRDLFDNTQQLIYSCNPGGRILSTNPAWQMALGYTADEATRLTMWDFIAARHHARCRDLFNRVLCGERVSQFTTVFVSKRGREFAVEGQASCRMVDGRPHSVQCVFQDVTTEREMAERLLRTNREVEQLREQATRDALTGVWNRRVILETLEREAARPPSAGYCLLVALLDLDHFKQVNDTHGHPSGDAVLAEVGRRLIAAVRPDDAVGRYGGEEFVAVLRVAADVIPFALADRLRRAVVAGPIQTPVGELNVTASIGGAVHRPGDTSDITELIHRADQALYQAKAAGRNQTMIAPSGLQGSSL